MSVSIKTEEEIDKMRVAGRLAADVLDMIEPYVQPGISTAELDPSAMIIWSTSNRLCLPRSITAAFQNLSAPR